MKLREYAQKINLLAGLHPEVDVISASDEEGNSFWKVGWDPSIGYFDGETFVSESDEVNAICVN